MENSPTQEKPNDGIFSEICPISLQNDEISSPVIYKLVRIEGDGRLIPATDYEIMEVENMFEEAAVEAPSHADGGQTEGHTLTEESFSVVSKSEDLEGKPQGEHTKTDSQKLNARIECIGLMLQKVKQEEKLRLSSSSSDHMVVERQCSDPPDKLSADREKFQTNHSLLEHDLPSPRLNARCVSHLGSIGTSLRPTDSLEVSSFSVSDSSYASSSGFMPDITRINDEICLDNQTVRELQDTFKATFGRETSVKDKPWLKRRIAMGLSNSSCVSTTTTLIAKDHVLVGKKEKKALFRIDCSNRMNHNMGYGDVYRDPHTTSTTKAGAQQVKSCKRLRKPKVEYGCKDEDVCKQQSAVKRVRKRTRRYIEELSEAESRECDGRSLSSMQNHANPKSSPKSRVRPICDVSIGETVFVTRHDYLGGSHVQVPVVSRVRRGRPRESLMSVMTEGDGRLVPATDDETMEVENMFEEAAAEVSLHADGGQTEGNKFNEESFPAVSKTEDLEGRAQGEHTEIDSKKLNAHIEVGSKRYQEGNLWKLREEKKQNLELECNDSFDDDSDCNGTLPTSRYGIRRKHHRPWTLGEVIKLVEGVSKYGAGRWSEIKKVVFASYSYRTSVDLKDKWRNLLKASFTQGSNDNVMSNSRKHGSVPVPASILLRVRQLAETHSQAEPDFNPGKFIGRSERCLHETRSGFL